MGQATETGEVSPLPHRKVVFMGSDAIALPLLDWLQHAGAAGGFVLEAVFSQPDRPHGRGQKLRPNPVAAWAREMGVSLYQPEKPGQAELDYLRNTQCDLVLVMAYGHLLRRALLEVPPLGFVNFHASLLPQYRGASPVETAVAMGEKETGVSLMRIIARMDAGPVCDREKVSISPDDTAGVIREKLASACVPLIERAMPSLLRGEALFHEQDEAQASYCRKLEKQDGRLDFNAAACVLAARINGFDPWPGAYCEHGEQRLKLRHARADSGECDAGVSPGTVLAGDGQSVRVATGEGVLSIAELQRPGGKMLRAPDFLRGYPLEPGTSLVGGPMAPLVSREAFTHKKTPAQ